MPRSESDAARIVGARLAARRQAVGITQRELQDLAGVDVSNIGKYERGQALPNIGTLVRLAAVLGSDPGDYLTGLKPTQLPGRPEAFSAREFVAERRRRAGR